jgi:ankyrin repeat protein
MPRKIHTIPTARAPKTFLVDDWYITEGNLHELLYRYPHESIRRIFDIHIAKLREFVRPSHLNTSDSYSNLEDLEYVVSELGKFRKILNKPLEDRVFPFDARIGYSPIQLVISRDRPVECLELLIEFKADINDTQARNKNALHHAIQVGS